MSDKNKYEFLLVLDARSAEDAKPMIERITGEFESAGAKVESVQNMDKRELAYAPGTLSSGVFVNFVVESDPALVDVIQSKFKLDREIYRQNCHRVSTKKVAKAS